MPQKENYPLLVFIPANHFQLSGLILPGHYCPLNNIQGMELHLIQLQGRHNMSRLYGIPVRVPREIKNKMSAGLEPIALYP